MTGRSPGLIQLNACGMLRAHRVGLLFVLCPDLVRREEFAVEEVERVRRGRCFWNDREVVVNRAT